LVLGYWSVVRIWSQGGHRGGQCTGIVDAVVEKVRMVVVVVVDK
jgi:hypothetical protein